MRRSHRVHLARYLEQSCKYLHHCDMIPSVQYGKRIIYLHIFQPLQTCFTFVKFNHIFIFLLNTPNLQKTILMMQGKMTTLHGFSKNLLCPGYVNSCNDALIPK